MPQPLMHLMHFGLKVMGVVPQALQAGQSHGSVELQTAAAAPAAAGVAGGSGVGAVGNVRQLRGRGGRCRASARASPGCLAVITCLSHTFSEHHKQQDPEEAHGHEGEGEHCLFGLCYVKRLSVKFRKDCVARLRQTGR